MLTDPRQEPPGTHHRQRSSTACPKADPPETAACATPMTRRSTQQPATEPHPPRTSLRRTTNPPHTTSHHTTLRPREQHLAGYLRARQQTPTGWMFLVGLPLWRNVGTEGEGVEASEYRVLLTSAQVGPLKGVDYSQVETHRLPAVASPADAPWAWSVQRLRSADGRPAGTMVHEYGCELSPGGASELNLDEALSALERTGARLQAMRGRRGAGALPRRCRGASRHRVKPDADPPSARRACCRARTSAITALISSSA
ncbi:DUF6233 domain-containing protein [Streptomyces spectabilis]